MSQETLQKIVFAQHHDKKQSSMKPVVGEYKICYMLLSLSTRQINPRKHHHRFYKTFLLKSGLTKIPKNVKNMPPS